MNEVEQFFSVNCLFLPVTHFSTELLLIISIYRNTLYSKEISLFLCNPPLVFCFYSAVGFLAEIFTLN